LPRHPRSAPPTPQQRFNYDDSLDVFGVHGIGGLIEGHRQQVLIQLYGIAVTLAWSAGVTYALLKLVSLFVPLPVSREQEMESLDITQHGEALQ
jgi:ammonium transporter, Amt family